MGEMPRPRPPYLLRQVTRHGRPVWYVRVGKGRRIRIRATYGTSEFAREYQAAVDGKSIKSARSTPPVSSLAWLIERYRETDAWTRLSMATRRQRENIFKQAVNTAGTEPISRISSEHILAGRARRAKTPAQARHFLDSMRGLFRWALEAGLVKADPTAGVSNPPSKQGDGFRPWSEDDVNAYERRWPIGTRQRVWLAVLLYTGLRRGDAVRLGRQHVRDGTASIKTEKTGVIVAIPILPVLDVVLKAGPCGDLTFIAGAGGNPLTKESFGNLFKKACRAAGVPGSAHGVRKIAATTAANNGATVAQLEAIFGWSGGGMASRYTRSADRKRLARDAVHLLANKERTSIPSPRHQVRAPEQKPK